jgi:hypothetical protein
MKGEAAMSEKTLARKVIRDLKSLDYQTVADRHEISVGHIYCLELQYGTN